METDFKNARFESFINNLAKVSKKSEEKDKIHVNELAGNIYFVYEKVRNAIEYREQHLFRRSAIERLITRESIVNEGRLEGLGSQIIKELIKTRYLKNDSLPVSTAHKLENILIKYSFFYRELKNSPNKKAKKYLRDVLVMAACEIETTIWEYEYYGEELYINFVYDSFLANLDVDSTADQSTVFTSVYYAVHRSLWKSDRPTIEYYFFKNSFPEWNKKSISYPEMVKTYISFKEFSEKVVASRIYFKIQGVVRKNMAPYKIIRVALFKENILDKYDDRKVFLGKIHSILLREYNEIRQKTSRKIVQSVIYIFLTKIFLAIVVELPYDLIVKGVINYVPLVINLVFPPFFMFLLGTLISTPDKNNTIEINTRIDSIIYGGPDQKKYKVIETKKKGSPIFTFLYLLTFFGSFYLVTYFLRILDFNIVSGLLFFIFFSTVSFFGYRVSQGAKELILIENKKTIKEVLLDFFTFPFIKVGQWLSDKYSQINIFMFVLDYMIEIPLKTFLSIFESWSSYINQKKEDILDR